MERSDLVSKSVLPPDSSFPVCVPSEIGECREWALLFPAWSMVLVLLTYLAYFSLALFATPAFSDLSTITGTFNSPVSLHSRPFNRPARFQGPAPRSSHFRLCGRRGGDGDV